METLQNILANWPSVVENVGIIGGLLYTGLAFRRDIRIRTAEMVFKVTSEHREVHRGLKSPRATLFDPARDMNARPLSEDEALDLGAMVNHLRSTFYLERARIYVQPYGLTADIDSFFSSPAGAFFWKENKCYHEPKFVAYVERRMRR